MRGLSIVDMVQQDLEALYRINTGVPVSAYVIDAHLLSLLTKGALGPERDRLLIGEEIPGHLDLAVYLHTSRLELLQDLDPRKRLGTGTLCALLNVIEEVSHFVLVLWSNAEDRQLSHFDLELQAEIDKYLLCCQYLLTQGLAFENILTALELVLFERFSLQLDLEEEELERYQRSNQLAHAYIRHLRRTFVLGKLWHLMFEEARGFYRLSRMQKLAHIQRTTRRRF